MDLKDVLSNPMSFNISYPQKYFHDFMYFIWQVIACFPIWVQVEAAIKEY